MSWYPSNLQWWPIKYCYELIDFYVFSVFQSIVVIIQFVARIISS